jgi:exodeoxyribonuclease VII large subunit
MFDNSRKPSSPVTGESAFTVSELTHKIKALLEGDVGRVTVEGEIGNLSRAASGHLYLSLKDSRALIDVVMWRSSASRLRFTPAEGDKVIAKGEVTVYEPRGRYQLVVSSLQPLGQGDLQAKFEELVAKLRDEGLFLPEHKKPLPEKPEIIGVVTSPTGAAIRDIIKVARRRMPGVKIVVSPCIVQGPGAATQIAQALDKLERWGQCDVIIIGRGGGSQEDLWAFNEEVVARAIFAARTPIVSAVGHEVDLSIADLVADVRAATPSEAAETVAPDLSQYIRQLKNLQRSLSAALRTQVRDLRARLAQVAQARVLRKPWDIVHARRQLLDEKLDRFNRAGTVLLNEKTGALKLLSAKLESLSPLAVLSRGYSVTVNETGAVIKTAGQVKIGDRIETRLNEGRLVSAITEILDGEESRGV